MPDFAYLHSPVGLLRIEASEYGITSVTIAKDAMHLAVPIDNSHLEAATVQLEDYFSGKRKDFSLLFDFGDASDFYQQVWQQLQLIPYGEQITYGELAKRVGMPRAAQAVGQANGKNPIAILIPCHRVTGAKGKLTGYAWGIEKKRWLLTHEMSHTAPREGMLF